jgi:hypothetical protein
VISVRRFERGEGAAQLAGSHLGLAAGENDWTASCSMTATLSMTAAAR